jgi:hypothetical protein
VWPVFLQYGFPLNFCGPDISCINRENHASARNFPSHIDKYIDKQIKANSLAGPLDVSKFPGFHVNPLMSREKATSNDRRVILDMSYPEDKAPNTFIPRDNYLGEPCKLKLPSPRHLADLILERGKGCYVSCYDLLNAYKQLPLTPEDWIYTGMKFKGKSYMEIKLPFGAPHSAGLMQNTLLAVIFILEEMGIVSLGYIDDIASVNTDYLSAIVDYVIILTVLEALGLDVAQHKLIPPSTLVIWLGVEFDTVEMTMKVPRSKLTAIVDICKEHACSSTIRRKALKSILGKLLHIVQILPTLRLFMNRLLLALKQDGDIIEITDIMKYDFMWLVDNLGKFNNTALIRESSHASTHLVIEGDCNNINISFLGQTKKVKEKKQQGLHVLEVIHEILDSVKEILASKTIIVDNRSPAYILVLKNGRTKNLEILEVARKIWFITTKYDIVLNIL